MSGSLYGDGNRVPGGSFCPGAISRHYIGLWKCQQADGDSDDEQITDSSGNEAHASIGSLTTAEAWTTGESFSSLATTDHWGLVPYAQWGHLWATDSLLLMFELTATAATDGRVWGAGTSASVTGGNLLFNASGRLVLSIRGTGATGVSTAPSGPDWSGGATHTVMLAYDASTRRVNIGTDGAITLSNNANISSALFDTVDSAHASHVGIGGRALATANMVANSQRFIHALRFRDRGLPTNFADIFERYHGSAGNMRRAVRDRDLVW